jgi:hypothetical protein
VETDEAPITSAKSVGCPEPQRDEWGAPVGLGGLGRGLSLTPHAQARARLPDQDVRPGYAKLAYQFRGIINELYLTDLKKKTQRGQMGQVQRGRRGYGYAGVPDDGTKGVFPVKHRKKGFGGKQPSYVDSHPSQLLSGSLQCGACGGAIDLVSGKGSGYYGCLNASRRSCDNKMLIARKRLDRKVCRRDQ